MAPVPRRGRALRSPALAAGVITLSMGGVKGESFAAIRTFRREMNECLLERLDVWSAPAPR
jgi:hypothetical protein